MKVLCRHLQVLPQQKHQQHKKILMLTLLLHKLLTIISILKFQVLVSKQIGQDHLQLQQNNLPLQHLHQLFFNLPQILEIRLIIHTVQVVQKVVNSQHSRIMLEVSHIQVLQVTLLTLSNRVLCQLHQ